MPQNYLGMEEETIRQMA